MSPRGPRVRFLVHGAERSGPPIYLLRLLRFWATNTPSFEPEVILARPGPLATSFAENAPVHVTRLDGSSIDRRVERRISAVGGGRLGVSVRNAAIRLRSPRSAADISVVNGATHPTVALLEALNPPGPVITIAHELSTGWYENITAEERHILLDRTDRYLAVSKAVAEFLVGDLGVPPERINICRPPVDIYSCNDQREDPDRVVVGGGGVHDWRKAPELWLQVAALVLQQIPRSKVEFVWFGGHPPGEPPAWPIRHEIHHLGLEGMVTFMGEVESPQETLARMDLFVSTAREDAYPLVCAEACASGVPVLTFDSGGAAEMVADSGCGMVFRYPDVHLMAASLIELINTPSLRRELGSDGRSFASAFLSSDVVAPKVESWILGQEAT